MTTDRHHAGHSDRGQRREDNEDRWLADDRLGLFVVCDGMGGMSAGEIASQSAIDAVLAEASRVASQTPGGLAGLTPSGLEQCAEHLVRTAASTVMRHADAHPELKGMGTTMTLLLAPGGVGAMAHAGDSRLYRMRGRTLEQLSSDDTIAAEFVRMGMTPAPQFQHVLTQALGHASAAELDVETRLVQILPGDLFLLCSDGLTRELGDEDLARSLHVGPLHALPARLVEMANARGGRDNITAIVLAVGIDTRTRSSGAHVVKING